ncbi:hypothetical protein K491DRAFT_685229 [Lophiostoma macrostomum CBS 122681]|uniref:Uncharacterized protein n=1 Tax=Lophiostoma macrostomum CBS 122681 TaxID=1314788 RepID=A0A6A6SN88_9PLEO|nr:hypothetical protein K491DRAFT_685229 [Lophiostoma macrostomum CBS 122681]
MRIHPGTARSFEDVSPSPSLRAAPLNSPSAEDHCDQMSTLLRDMRGNSSAEHGARIDELLQTLPENQSPNAPRALASSASDSQSPLRDTTPFDPDYMSICEPEVFDSSPVVTQPHSNYNRRVVVPEAEGRMGGTRVPTGRVHAAPTPDGRVNDPGGFHRQAALPWQAYSGDFTQTYEFPDNFPPNQLPPWQDTSHTFVTLAWSTASLPLARFKPRQSLRS